MKNAECAGYCGEGGVRLQRSVVLSVVTTLWPFFKVGSHKACTGQSSREWLYFQKEWTTLPTSFIFSRGATHSSSEAPTILLRDF